ncbi:trypsin-like serine protease [Basidiobolus meristosporus CBS 931.73]|uniref:Trypsin-like serine protease n=1 Tax=Basidiobolus meristosporus CBS 931.73 TaxID=1314790 RepID=A0A1Y1YYR5_9FUNG|nr:trypsin-like serine protease [Basidiobolus meristosporus CBS 931.73]|eukprot:ORY03180.1 trypsin-like serine protease [Basidiobolus meristosporus CBS 931.73]
MRGALLVGAFCSLVACPLVHTELSPLQYIENGRPRGFDEVPYLVSIHDTSDAYCSGVLLSDTWVLSTQFCLQTSAENDTVTAISKSNVSKVRVYASGGASYENIPVKRVVPRYSALIGEQKLSNILLIELEHKVNQTQTSLFATIGNSNLMAQEMLEATGLSDEELFSSLTVTVQEPDTCRLLHWREIEIRDSPMICGTVDMSQSTGDGDSGGPLYRRKSNGQTSVYGLIAGISLLNEEYYTFVNLQYHLSWISRTTGIPKGTLLSKSAKLKGNPSLGIMLLLVFLWFH